MPSSQEPVTGRTRVPHEPSRLHAVLRTWNKFYCCRWVTYKSCLLFAGIPSKSHYLQACWILLAPPILLSRFNLLSYFQNILTLEDILPFGGETSFALYRTVACTAVHLNVTSFRRVTRRVRNEWCWPYFFPYCNSPWWPRASQLSKLHDYSQTHNIR
jgi:hypothetical protein